MSYQISVLTSHRILMENIKWCQMDLKMSQELLPKRY